MDGKVWQTSPLDLLVPLYWSAAAIAVTEYRPVQGDQTPVPQTLEHPCIAEVAVTDRDGQALGSWLVRGYRVFPRSIKILMVRFSEHEALVGYALKCPVASCP